MNKVILVGNLAADPEGRTTQSGIAQCSFRIAVQRRFANKETGQREADFISCVAWRQTAEFIQKYFVKGARIIVEGSLQTRSYDAQDGTKRHVTEVIVDNAEFGAPRAAAPAESDAVYAGAPKSVGGDARQMGFTEVDNDDLPF